VSTNDYDTKWVDGNEFVIGESHRQKHLEDAVGSLIAKMRELAQTVRVLESRHGSLIDHGSFDGSRCGSIADIDAAISDFLDGASVTSSGSTRSFLNITVVFDGGFSSTDFSSGPSVDCGYGQDDAINTVVINFDAGNSIYNSMRHRRSSIGSIDSSISEEDEEEITLDGGFSNTNYTKRPSMDCGNAGENETDTRDLCENPRHLGYHGDTGHTGHNHIISFPIQNNYF
jgi:hypothetical protein